MRVTPSGAETYQAHNIERAAARARITSATRQGRRAIELFIKPTVGAFKSVDVERNDIAGLHQKYCD